MKRKPEHERIHIGIVVSEFNYDITMMMLERAKEHAHFLDVKIEKIIRVPGVFDMPIAVKKLMQDNTIDGVAVLGAVIEGDTDHDDIVMQQTSRKIVDLSIEFEKPLGFGITGPGMTRLQAQERIDRAKYAVETVVKLYKGLQ